MPVMTRQRQTHRPLSGHPEQAPAAPPDLAPPATWYVPARDVLEFGVTLVLLTLAAPVILLLAALVKLTSPGPAFYSQTRVGKGGRPYQIYKLRTMRRDAETRSGPQWSTPSDTRVTWLGRFLRKSHLDELPQLWNVLMGDMSLIGPRPERPEFVATLRRAVPHYADRLLVSPGVTGLAQIQLPADTDLESVRRKVAYDLYYVQHVTLWLDVRILFLTAFYAAGSKVFWPFRLLGMPRPQRIEGAYQERCAQLPPEPAVPVPAPAATDTLVDIDLGACVSASADTLVDINLGARADGWPEPAASAAAEPVVAGV
jgi:lipopolysaccharide/colanic/teichoic acid biosynthesis glycosyltransferase